MDFFNSLSKKNPFRAYLLIALFWIVVSLIPISFLGFVISEPADDFGETIGVFNAAVQLLITVPLSWLLFKRQMQGSEEIYALKTELGKSNANLDFLRSQINPHFLFNALNTIYGTAIQEKAERTSEGIERLGDMMRFMLQENQQEKISLTREIEYLNNYISLQKLRTDPNPCIKIEAAIDLPVNVAQVAPMLLIPFVENAFKHGISFREPSHIKITLELKENTLYFDVYNSKHLKPENDPEKHQSGIGLPNVKQRLQHLYPTKHELIIRETGKEFYVHLTIKLA
ncbi:MAG: putative two-component system sensor protein, no kinase domain [uncultured Segetibacter sp.]|uniref:Putative two-component system sensor protein, no kinase domain n=1 Tax=uncultured Segetibacter sp. TaxID=481133 RepID=A0A6J4U4S0_9BACT|nr:MAG: putative two-component system sensor protein, no kinase domain [uncultured Segetibacter sp.]